MELNCNRCAKHILWGVPFFFVCEEGHKYLLRNGVWRDVAVYPNLHYIFKEIYSDRLKKLIGGK